MFSKNKPTEKISFDGGWVELQHLSKGVKDEIQTRLASLVKDLDKFKDLKENDVPEDLDMGVIKKINEVEYYKLSKAIKSWSEKDLEITEETVQDLDGEVFTQISNKINEMNTLDQTERKN
jgi:hypothetical protein